MSDRSIELGKVMLKDTHKYLKLGLQYGGNKNYFLSAMVCWDTDMGSSCDVFAGEFSKIEIAPRFSAKKLKELGSLVRSTSFPATRALIDKVLAKNKFEEATLIEA